MCRDVYINLSTFLRVYFRSIKALYIVVIGLYQLYIRGHLYNGGIKLFKEINDSLRLG